MTTMITYLFAVHCFFFALNANPSAGFVPNGINQFMLRSVTGQSDSYDTHEDMSKKALITVAAEVLRDNPNPHDEASTQRISALLTGDSLPLNEKNLLFAYYNIGSTQRLAPSFISRIQEFRKTLNKITVANADVDDKEKTNAAAHFDSEQFQAGQGRLVQIRQNVISSVLRENFDFARTETGRMLHTLQDFYSHSNWIENGNRSPYPLLDKEISFKSADRSMKTCTDCEIVDRFNFNIPLPLFYRLLLGQFTTPIMIEAIKYECINNIVANDILTSGYYEGQKDTENNDIHKAPGKCSHGGFFDGTANSYAKGGINKDSPNDWWSPHHYLFNEAATVAQLATVELMRDIRNMVNDDYKFSEYLGITLTVPVKSVAYVIDTTGSMGEELPEIQATINRELIESEGFVEIRYILVPFNDPDPGHSFITQNIEEFLNSISELFASGGGDTPEPSIGALIRAIKASVPGSPIYVFTDAPASDEHRLNEALAFIKEKEVSVSFVLANSFRGRRSLSYDTNTQKHQSKQLRIKKQIAYNSVYERIATFSGGQVLNINTDDISEIGSIISFSTTEDHTTIFRKEGISFTTDEYFFFVDSFSTRVFIFVNGEYIITSLSTPNGVTATTLPQYLLLVSSSTLHISNINVTDNTLRGKWKLTIQSGGLYDIQIKAASDLTFSVTFYGNDSSNDHETSKVDGKPLQGQLILALINVQGVFLSNNITAITKLNLINLQGSILESLDNLTQIYENSYVGEFLQPSESFRLQLIGMDFAGYNFSRISETPVETTSIRLTLDGFTSRYLTLRPGENATVKLILQNTGEASTFKMTVKAATTGNSTESFFEYAIFPENVTLETSGESELAVDIYLSNDTIDGLVVTFTATAASIEDESINNFITFNMVTTTLPHPVITENECSEGYSLNLEDGTTCEDIDECSMGNGGCSQVCINTAGSFLCSCRDGYILAEDGMTCSDADECSTDSHNCEQKCLNTLGSYTCGCDEGLVLISDGRSCDDPVYLEFKGKRIPKNVSIPISQVGEGTNAVLCKTNKQDCCYLPDKNRHGQFYYPNGITVPIRRAGTGFYRNRGDQLIRLNKRNNINSPTGRYTCEIPDASGIMHTLYVTLN